MAADGHLSTESSPLAGESVGVGSFAQADDGTKLYYLDAPGPPLATPVVCLHGLSRNSRDFEDLVPHLSRSRRVLALDFRGRGKSDFDSRWQNYQPVTYAHDTVAVLEQAGISHAVFIGTSLGGLVSMILASRFPERVSAVVLNDIGPEIAPEGLSRITEYCGTHPPVADWHEAVNQARNTYGHAWPGLSDEEWLRIAKRSYRELKDGTVRTDMDPNIGRAIREAGTELGDPWDLFGALAAIPTLTLRGAQSDILTRETVEKMHARKPDMEFAEIANRGHVPLLDEPDSLRAIDHFLANLP